MGNPVSPAPVKLFVGMLSANVMLLQEAEKMLVERFGPVELRSDLLPFDYTDYYAPSMGPDLLRRLIGFSRPVAAPSLVEIKLLTNEVEEQLARRPNMAAPRPVNLDPGYLTPAKVVLATTKDYAHRIYLNRGIYAEVTLHYHRGRYESWPWTYPDYRTEPFQQFFLHLRRQLVQSLKEDAAQWK